MTEYRYLLHGRRVPLLDQAAQQPLGPPAPQAEASSAKSCVFRCAGISDPDQTCWICKDCRNGLCTPCPTMPSPALANLMWAGREHPLCQKLTEAVKMLLSLGRPLLRKIILGKGDPADSSAALLGNTVLLAQPTTGEIQKQMPPPREIATDRLAVMFTTPAKM